jgi:uncharacterized protein YbaA (DUF1428 family)
VTAANGGRYRVSFLTSLAGEYRLSVLVFPAKQVVARQESLHDDEECLSKTPQDAIDSEEGAPTSIDAQTSLSLLQLPLGFRLVVARSTQRSAPAVDMWRLYSPDHLAYHLKAEVLAAYKTETMAIHRSHLTRQVTTHAASPIDWRKVGLLILGLTFLALVGRLVFWAFLDEKVASAEVVLKAKVADPPVCEFKDVPEDKVMSFSGAQDSKDNDAIVMKLREQSESIRKKLKLPSRKREVESALSDPWSKVDNISDDNDRHTGGQRSPLLTSETSSVETGEGPSTGASSDSSSTGSVASVPRIAAPSAETIIFSFAVYGTLQIIVSYFFTTCFFLQQFLVLPFRLYGGQPLAFVLHSSHQSCHV